MSELTPLAKTLLCAFGVFVVLVNLALVGFLLRRKDGRQQKAMRMQRRLREEIRNPWAREDQQWQELSRQVERYKSSPDENQTPDEH